MPNDAVRQMGHVFIIAGSLHLLTSDIDQLGETIGDTCAKCSVTSITYIRPHAGYRTNSNYNLLHQCTSACDPHSCELPGQSDVQLISELLHFWSVHAPHYLDCKTVITDQP